MTAAPRPQQVDGDAGQSVPGRVRQQALATPAAVALVHGTRRVSYDELDRLADRYAGHLAALGLQAGDLLPVRMPRSVRLVGVLLGALRLGAAYALMDAAWPDERVRDELDQLRATLFVTDAWNGGGQVPTWSAPDEPSCRPPSSLPHVRAEDGCSVFFTSGTTGRPKGAVSPHSGVIRLVDRDSPLPIGPWTVIPSTAAMPWDLFSLELWAPLMTGGTVVLIDEPFLTGALIRELMARDGLNTVWATTTLFNMLVDEDVQCFRGLRAVMVGGERLSPAHVRAFLAAHPATALINGYGPVEATVFVTARVIGPQDCDVPGGIPIGTPVPRTTAHVLDGERPCRDGEVGELCFGGAGLALEYLGDPELTARKFPVLQGERLYRTGDLGLRDADGVLHYRGRIDRQLKVRGHRVEPGEVEAVIAGQPDVVRAVVLPRQDPDGRCTGILAFYTARRPVPAADLRRQLALAVPSYQVPDQLLQVERIPLLRNGKLDANALLDQLAEQDAAGRDDTVPQDRDEDDTLVSAVAEVVGGVLRLPPQRVPQDVTLTSLGASSLDAGRIAARLHAVVGRPVPVSQIFLTPTLRSLTGWMRDVQAATPVPAAPAAGAGACDSGRLSGLQAHLLMEHLFDPDGLAHHVVFAWRIEGRPDRRALRYAIERAHQRHCALACRYSLTSPALATRSGLPAPPLREFLVDSEDQARALLARELARPLRPEDGLVWQPVFVAVRQAPITLLALAAHHVAFDGGSAAPFAAGLSQDYQAFRAAGGRSTTAPDDGPPSPGAGSLGPAAIAAARDAHLRYVDLPAQREYWRHALADLPPLQLPRPQPAVGGGASAAPGRSELPMLQRTIGSDVLAGVARTAAQHAVSPFVVQLTAYAQAVAHLTGQSDFGIGTSYNRRGHSALADTVGCFIDVLCLRIRTDPAHAPADALAATGEAVRGAFGAQDVTIAEVAQLADLPAPPGRSPLFQNIFLLQDNAPAMLDLPGTAATVFRPPYPGAPSEVVTEVWPQPDGSGLLVVSYQPDKVSEDFCHALAEIFPVRLHALAGALC